MHIHGTINITSYIYIRTTLSYVSHVYKLNDMCHVHIGLHVSFDKG